MVQSFMFQALNQRLKSAQDRIENAMDADISTPQGRRSAKWHFQLMDHAFLRYWWTNLYEIAPGIWRSNQPDPKRIARYSKLGIKSIIFLRGDSTRSYAQFEEEACAKHGIAFHRARLLSRDLVPAEEVLHVLDLFKTVEKPFLMHCKSGADRAGLASALWILAEGSGDIEEAKAQMSFRYMHLKNDKTGVLDMMLQIYEEDFEKSGIGIREWLETAYNPIEIKERFRTEGLRKTPRG